MKVRLTHFYGWNTPKAYSAVNFFFMMDMQFCFDEFLKRVRKKTYCHRFNYINYYFTLLSVDLAKQVIFF